MTAIVNKRFPPHILAAARRCVKVVEIRTAFAPALDEVWAFLGKHPRLRSDGYNLPFHL
jgi:hypothetical protein